MQRVGEGWLGPTVNGSCFCKVTSRLGSDTLGLFCFDKLCRCYWQNTSADLLTLWMNLLLIKLPQHPQSMAVHCMISVTLRLFSLQTPWRLRFLKPHYLLVPQMVSSFTVNIALFQRLCNVQRMINGSEKVQLGLKDQWDVSHWWVQL